ncbi:MAG: VTT domain-containing protein [Gemmatimonadetes bacterium]|nr:VTT domain-containing protein [Gemmatimonadota bacterium]
MAQVDETGRPGGDVPGTGGPNRTGPLLKLALLVAVLAGGYLVATQTPVSNYLTREGIGEAMAWLSGHPWAPFIFVTIYATATSLAVPGTILTLAGGALFGFYWGTLFNFVAANIGANAAFLIARTLGRDGIRGLIGKDSTALQKLDDVVHRHGFRGLLTLRLIPLVPFNALNFGSGLMPLRWRTYAVATLVGILPGTAVYTFFADALLQGSREASRDALLRVLLAGVLLLLLSFLPAILKRMNVRLPGMTAVVALVCGSVLAGRGVASSTPALQLPGHAVFTEVLADVVELPGVHYERLAADPSGLYRYIDMLDTASPAALAEASAAERLAFWINAYNACMLKRVIEHYPIRKAGGLQRLKNAAAGRPDNSVWQISDVFTGDHCPVAGKVRSLDEIEHEIIRPMGDPRIHFAINCAARSCPPLIDRAYEGHSLEDQLDARVRAFVQDPAHFRVVMGQSPETVQVNRVLEWFQEDFGGVEGIRSFLAGFAEGDAGEALLSSAAELEFLDYDWTLNDASR